MKISANIRRHRIEAGLSQEELGARLGVSGQAISKWEQSVTAPDISLLPLIAETFGVTIDSLFRNEPERQYKGYGGRRHELSAAYAHSRSEEDFKAAADAFAEVILNGAPTADDYRCYAMLHNERAHRDVETALRYYRRAIAEGDGNRDMSWMSAHQELTNLLHWIGRTDEAVRQWREWAEREPECCWAHVSYGYALEVSGDSDGAYREYMRAVEIDENDANAQTAAGDILGKLGRIDEACVHWAKAYELEPTQISCLFSRAEALAAAGRTEEAVAQYREILAGGTRLQHDL